MLPVTYIKVAQVAEEHGSIFQKRLQVFFCDATFRDQGIPFPAASMIEVDDEVEDIWALRRDLPHYDPATMPGGSSEIMGVELLTRLEGIENGLDHKLIDCSVRERVISAFNWGHDVRWRRVDSRRILLLCYRKTLQ